MHTKISPIFLGHRNQDQDQESGSGIRIRESGVIIHNVIICHRRSFRSFCRCILQYDKAIRCCIETICASCNSLHQSLFFFKLYAFILLTSTLVPGINYFAFTTHPLHQLQVRKRSSSSCYMIETYNTRHRFPCY